MSTLLIDRLRRTAKIEAVSFLVLLFIAMPLKYLAGKPLAVRVVGSIHGILFILFCWALARARFKAGLPMRLAVMTFIASLLPFGPFVIDHKLQAAEVIVDQDPQ